MTLRRLFIAVLVPAVLALAAWSPVAAQDSEDILSVRPESLRGEDVEALVAEANASYAERRYADAARAFIRALRQRPGDPTNLYNLACCYGLLGHEDPAIEFLRASWEAGFRDLAHIRRDPDFDRVRGTERFEKLLEAFAADAERRAGLTGRVLPVETKSVAGVRVMAPESMQPGRRYPLVVGLHGFGDNAENFVGLFRRRGVAADFVFAVPEAPYPFLPGTKIGYSWFLRGEGVEPRTWLRSADLTRRYVLDVLEAVKKEYPIDERNVFLLGFSQGAGLAFSVGMREPDRFRGVIPIGGWVAPGEFPRRTVARAAKQGRFLVCHSPEDRVVPFEGAEAAVEFLDESGIDHELFRYAGGHTISAAVIAKILEWMELPPAAHEAEEEEEEGDEEEAEASPERSSASLAGTWVLDVDALRADAAGTPAEDHLPDDIDLSVVFGADGTFRMSIRTGDADAARRETASGDWRLEGDRITLLSNEVNGVRKTDVKTGTFEDGVIRIGPDDDSDSRLPITLRRKK